MDGWLKALIAATCVAVLAGAGWFGWREWSEAERRAALAATMAEAERASERSASRGDCNARIAAWEGDGRAQLVSDYGKRAEQVVESCRYLVRAIATWDAEDAAP